LSGCGAGRIELASAWPGWTGAGTLLIAIDAALWAPPSSPLELDGRVFAPKLELHVTVVGKRLGAEVLAAIEARRVDPDALRRDFTGQRWRLRRSGRRVHLRKPAPDDAVESIIEPVALPAMARFHARLGEMLGRALPVPPPHVTLFVRGDAEGIGVPDRATLEQLRVAVL
jgi:hypothetical protein